MRPVLEALEARNLLNAAATGSVLDLSGLSVNTSNYSTTDILVQFRPMAAPVALPGTTLGAATGLVANLYTVQLGSGLSVAQALDAYQADGAVLSASPDYLLSAAGTATGVTPNDPKFPQQWDLSNTGQNTGTPGADIHATQAWSVTTGSPNVTVAVMDTGMDYNNPNLYLNVWINQAEIPNYWYTKTSATSGYDKIVYRSQIVTATPGVITFRDLNNPVNAGLVWKSDGNSYVDAGDLLRPLSQGGWENHITTDGDTAHPDDFFGWNFVANNNNPFDQNGHGTFVSGTIGAVGNDGIGIAGVDWNVQLMPVQFLGADGSGTISVFIEGLNYAVAHGAKISNNSWTGADNDSFLLAAIQNAQQHGQIFVAAAGNGSVNNDVNPSYPASFPLNNIVAVAATDNHDNLAGFSGYGAKTVALAAPGVGILGPTLNNSYSVFSGTSMSAPLVTGVLALVWGQHPSWTYTQVINQVLSTVQKVPSLSGEVSTGGVLNAAAAVGYNPASQIIPAVVSAVPSGPTTSSLNQFRVTFNEPISPAHFPTAQATLIGPSGQVIPITAIMPVAGSQNAEYILSFATQTQPGSYKLSIGPQIWDYWAHRMTAPYQTTYTLPSSSPPPPTVMSTPVVYQATTPVPVSSRGTAASSITINQDFTIQQLAVTLNVNAPIDGNMYIYLVAPDGTRLSLVNRRGGTGANFVNTVLSDSGALPIRDGSAPFTGTFQAEQALSTLTGKDARGTWTLYVVNMATGSVGTLQNWSLTFSPSTSTASVTAAGNPLPQGPPTLPTLTIASLPTGNSTPPGVDGVFASGAQMQTVQTTYYLPPRSTGATTSDSSGGS